MSNTGDNEVHAQVRVYHWTQQGGEDKLVPSRGLVISPPMVQIAPGERQLIRTIRLNAPPSGPGAVEDAYRIVIDELPVDSPTTSKLRFVLRYSVPVFVAPAGSTAPPPELGWALVRDGDKVALEVTNAGGSHAQLAALSFVNASGLRTELTAGLLGYVLPGAKMRWALKPPAEVFGSGGVLETMINGQTVHQETLLVGPAR